MNQKVVIIGSGIGGLMCGAILAKAGYSVTILEMNKQIGGTLQTYVRERHIFDSGVHYVGGLDKGQTLYKIFDYLGIMQDLKIVKMDVTAFDKICFHSDNKEYNFGQGYDQFKKNLIESFPSEEKAIMEYCNTIQKICASVPLYNLKLTENFRISSYYELDTKHFIASLTSNTRLQNVLAGNNPLYAGVGDKTPLYVHALVINSYIESAWRFVNGGSQIARSLCKIIRSHGGIIKTRTKVNKIHIDQELADHLVTEDGNKFFGDYFISTIHPTQTLKMIDSNIIKLSYRKRINSLENSTSSFMININLIPNTFKYSNSNYYCYLTDDVWNGMEHDDNSWPKFYAVFHSEFAKRKEFAEGVTIMAYMKYEEVSQWSHTYNTVTHPSDRGDDYAIFKKIKAEKLIDCVEQKFPGFRKCIKSYTTSTPLTFRDYMGTTDGSIYGIKKDYKDAIKSFISPRTKINNLFLSGQNINLHGILGVSISSLVSCSSLINLTDLLNKINNEPS